MKLNALEQASRQAKTTAPADKAGAASSGSPKAVATAPVDGARVALSPVASSLLAPPATADFDVQKVARVAKAIRDGQFKPNAAAIADALITRTHTWHSATSGSLDSAKNKAET
jgi:negative regulator of flagellin synthesis FlgM